MATSQSLRTKMSLISLFGSERGFALPSSHLVFHLAAARPRFRGQRRLHRSRPPGSGSWLGLLLAPGVVGEANGDEHADSGTHCSASSER